MQDGLGVDRLSPFDEMEMAELGVKQAELDEEMAMYDPDTEPRPPHPKSEGVTDLDGENMVDMQADTPDVDLLNFDVDDGMLDPL